MITLDQIKKLRPHIVTACHEDTAYQPGTYKGGTHGHCALVAKYLQDHYEVRVVSGTIEGVPHRWNRLDNGIEIDLTSDQFGGDGITPLKQGRLLLRHRGSDDFKERYKRFSDRVSASVNNE